MHCAPVLLLPFLPPSSPCPLHNTEANLHAWWADCCSQQPELPLHVPPLPQLLANDTAFTIRSPSPGGGGVAGSVTLDPSALEHKRAAQEAAVSGESVELQALADRIWLRWVGVEGRKRV